MTNKIFIGFILILCSIALCSANETEAIISTATELQTDISVSTKSAVFPKLLWEKTLTKSITSSAISKDGTKIAIADETGYLTLYNAKGEKLWDYRYKGEVPKRVYEFESDKSDTAFLNLVFSNNGKYIVCDVGVLSEQKYSYSFEDMFRYEPHKKFCFNDEGKLLWQSSKKGEHAIGGDKYVLIRPQGDESEDYELCLDYYVLDLKGQLVSTGKTNGYDVWAGGFSEDARYMFVDNKLIDCENWRTIWKFGHPGSVFIALYGNYITWSGPDMIFDIRTQKKLLDIGRGYGSSSPNYVARVNSKNLRIYGINHGRVIWTRQYKKGELSQNMIFNYIAEDEKHLIIGSVKNVFFYDIEGRELWRLPINMEEYNKFKYYSVNGNAEYFLFGHKKTVKLYKSF